MTRARRPLAAWRRPALFVCAAALLAPVAATADTCSGLALGAPSTQTIPSAPLAVAVGDFNRDGRPDVVATGTDGTVSLLLGTGSGSLGPAGTITTLTNPVDLLAVDYNRDGRLDLVVANGSAASVSLLPGNGNGTFGAASSAPLSLTPERLFLGDFNRDGRPDLVAISETSGQVQVFAGTGSGFGSVAVADLTVAAPSAAAAGDFDRDGKPDLAVASNTSPYAVSVFLGDGTGHLGDAANPPNPFWTVSTGTSPLDVAAGDLNRDGALDLVTANGGSADVSVLLGVGNGAFTPSTAATLGGTPRRVALVDLDRDGVLDLAVLDDSGQRVVALHGRRAFPPAFEPTPYPVGLAGAPAGLAAGDFTSDGRPDLVSAVATGQVAVLPNASGQSGASCPRASFGGAPRSYAAGDGPVSAAAADFNSDGRIDLVAADNFGQSLTLLRGAAAGFVPDPTVVSLGLAPRGVAAADFDGDGFADVAVVLGSELRVYRGNGLGGFALSATRPAGINPAAVVTGDFNGDGAKDAAVASEGSNAVFFFAGNGIGGLAAGTSIGVGAAPRALAATDYDADGRLDLAVACSGTSNVWILKGDGTGGFAVLAAKPAVGTEPWGIAAADLDADAKIDLVTADHGAATVSVLKGDGAGAFAAAVPYAVDSFPTAVAAVDVAGTARRDLVVSTAANHTVNLLVDNGLGGGYTTPRDVVAVRTSPQAVVPVDADGDGQADVAVPCRDSDAVVVLIARRSGSPALSTATSVGVGQTPLGAVSADFDRDGDPDLAVANSTGNTVSLLRNDGFGTFAASSTVGVGKAPESIVAADFNRDGLLDLATNAPGETTPSLPGVSILFGNPASPGSFLPFVKVDLGAAPDGLAVGDFDRDGDLDLAVCDAVPTGFVRILLNNGSGGFSAFGSFAVGTKPTALAATDLDGDGDLDLAVANDDSDNVSILLGNGSGSFAPSVQSPIALAALDSPVSIAACDLDGDGDPDLAVAAFGTNQLKVLRNEGPASPGTFTLLSPTPAPDLPLHVAAADINRDGRTDLALVATGLKILRGKGALAFEEAEQFVAGRSPVSAVVSDFNSDGQPDAAVVNKDSNDVSILLSTSCAASRLDVLAQPPAPPACGGGTGPYAFPATVRALDDGGNVAACTTGDVAAAIVPGTGDPTATLSGTTAAPLASGQASFTALTIDQPGKRYVLGFTLPGLPQAVSRRFTLGNALAITGPASFCASSSALYSASPGYDAYSWTLDAGPTPFAFTPQVTLQNPGVGLGAHALSAAARVDACAASAVAGVFVGDLQSVGLSLSGLATVCVDCLGGTVTPAETGGGAVVARQWGYRTVSGGAITDLPLETGPTYTVKGTDFPGPGDYDLVVRTTATCPAATPVVSSELQVTVYAAPPGGDVLNLGVRSSGAPGDGRNKLLWVNADAAASEILIRWRKAASATTDCAYPTSPTQTLPPDGGEVSLTDPARLTAVRAEQLVSGLELDRNYCYAVFVRRGAAWSSGRLVKGRPFDAATGPVKWAYATGATAVVPPVIGANGILAVSNDRTVHALTRGSSGGDWPPLWVPPSLQGVAHSRSPIVPFGPTSPTFPGKSIFFAADDTGSVFAIDSLTGQIQWSSTPSANMTMTGAPGAILAQFGGVRDLVLVGSRSRPPGTDPSEFFGLSLPAGSQATTPFNGPGPTNRLGPISGTPAVDYATGRVSFVSRRQGTGHTVWSLQIQPSGDPTVAWSRANLGEFDSSPVTRGGRVYVANDTVYSLDAASGGDDRSFSPGDGSVKGFVFPDRRNDDLIFATTTKVWSVSDDGSATMPKNWEWLVPAAAGPSVILYRPGTNLVYVGSGAGTLYELDFTNADPFTPPTSKLLVLGDGRGQIGAPSLDLAPPGGLPGQGLLVVGSESGVLYGVEVPLP